MPVDRGTLGLLRDHQAASRDLAEMFGLSLEPDSFVFAAEPGGAMFWRPDRASRSFRTWLVRAGLPHVPLYSLRHQAATTMIDRGVDAKTVSERLGNSVATVLTTYTRPRSKANLEAADLMGGIYDQ